MLLMQELLRADDIQFGKALKEALFSPVAVQSGVIRQDAMQMKEYVHALQSAFADVFEVTLTESHAVLFGSPTL